MPNLPQVAQLPPPAGPAEADLRQWSLGFTSAFVRLWIGLVHVVNALCKVDTAANRPSTPELNETFFYEHDTERLRIGVSGVWEHVGRLTGTADGAIPFTEISDPTAPATNNALVYSRDNGAGKTQLVVRFPTGAIQVIATEP